MTLIRPLRLRCGNGGEPGRRATWLELFFDLAFVAAVAQVGAPLAAQYNADGLVRYAFLFLLIWWAWNGHTNYATRFDTDDVVQRALAFTQIFVVAVMAVNAKDALDSRSSAGFAAAYAIMRLVLVAQYLRARRIVDSRNLTTAYSIGFGIAAVCWLISALVPAPFRFWLWGLALVIDVGTPIATSQLIVRVPPDAAHLPERFGLFTIILLGESMVAVMKGMESQEDWSLPAASTAFLGMGLAFLIWWWYFDAARAAADRSVASTRQARSLMVWSFAHLPLYLGIAVTAVGVEHLVKIAHDGHLHADEGWILSGAFAVLMLALTTIGAASDGTSRAPGTTSRLLPQYLVAVSPLALGFVASQLAPVIVVATLVTLCFVQVFLATRSVVPLELSAEPDALDGSLSF